jgi:hypothetical protein
LKSNNLSTLIIIYSLLISSISCKGPQQFNSSIIQTDSLRWNLGPVQELKWNYGPVSVGLVMDMCFVSLSGKNSQDLLLSRIWKGLYVYPFNKFTEKSSFSNSFFVGKSGVVMFQPVDWNNDGIEDLIAANRDGFLFLVPASGNYPDISYDISETTLLHDASDNLPFNIPQENPNFPRQDDLGGYTDIQYSNYLYPEFYPSLTGSSKDLIIGDSFGNLWWLPDVSDGKGKPVYTGEKYSKLKSRHEKGIQYQNTLGLDYAKPVEKICDNNGDPFLLGIGKETTHIFKGANTRPTVYPDEQGINGLLVISGTNNQNIYFLKRSNPPHEKKPSFRNMGEIFITGLDKSKLGFHSKLCLFKKNGKNDLLLASENYLAILQNTGWDKGIPKFLFSGWIQGANVPASGYRYDGIITDNQGKRYIIDFDYDHWKLIPVEKKENSIRLYYSDSLIIRDQNGVFHVEGETDPQFSPDWGYHRLSRWDFNGSGRNNMIVATDKGLLYLLVDDSVTKDKDKFTFRSTGPLKDITGTVIKIHNRAVAGGIDLNDDGLEDLIVGGISYQLGIKSDPNPGGGIFYIINKGLDSSGFPLLSPPRLLDLGKDFKPRINSHLGLQILDIDHDNKKEVIVSLQEPGWGGRVFRRVKNEIGLAYSGYRIPLEPIIEQIVDVNGDGQYDVVRPGDESGVGFFRTLNIIPEPGSQVCFHGDSVAELYSKELTESLNGILKYNFVMNDSVFPAGFVHASPPPQGWSNTFWTRDGGTLLRELVLWNKIDYAGKMAECLMQMVAKNNDGFYSFPQYFDKSFPKSGDELDGTSSIIIGMALLYRHLLPSDSLRIKIYTFLHQPSSPVAYIKHQLKGRPLLKGKGEFGGGCGIQGFYCNVVQNNLSALALLSVSEIEKMAGDTITARSLKNDSESIFRNMKKFLIDNEGSWIWCVNPETLKEDTIITRDPINLGFGGLNGVLSMYADVCGFNPVVNKSIFEPSLKTFNKLYETTLRKKQFDKYGIWTQFDVHGAGLITSPSYGQGYAMQAMLLMDSLNMMSKAVDFFALQTYQPVQGYIVHRKSPYYIYERMYSPDAPGKTEIVEGCGALNLVNVTEHLKVGRLMIGIDDSDPDTLKIIPRIPTSWSGYSASGWPAYTRNGISYINIEYNNTCNKISVKSTLPIKVLQIRIPFKKDWKWITKENCTEFIL